MPKKIRTTHTGGKLTQAQQLELLKLKMQGKLNDTENKKGHFVESNNNKKKKKQT